MDPLILDKKKYSQKCDIWSLGIIYYELLYGNLPWDFRSPQDYLMNLQRNPIEKRDFSKLSEVSSKFLKKALQVETKNRISWIELFELLQI